MSLSKARDRIRKRVEAAAKRGKTVQLSPTEEFDYLPKYKRVELLAEIALHPTEAPVTAGHRIAAIKEVNLMQHVYDSPPAGSPNIQIVVIDSQAHDMLKKVIEGERTLKLSPGGKG